MTSSVDSNSVTVVDDIDKVYTRADFNVGCPRHRHHRHVLRSKEKTYKHKCKKRLQKKLKKYKLRQDGAEDPDVLDVSQMFISALLIKSPNNNRESITKGCDLSYLEERPKNYLFKMVRRKEAVKIRTCVKSPNINIKQNEFDVPEPISSQDKKHMNAFQLLMDSRNKSIGSNSPGKERYDDQSDNEEMLEKKSTKAKRKLVLQKLAEAKGYLKNKEMDELQDKLIKKKMDKRAERLKNMILKETKPSEDNMQTKEKVNQKFHHKHEVEVTNNNDLKKNSKAFKIIDIFNTLNDPITISPEKKYIPKEDNEFLKKLSPSMKKKESMLSYFQKVDKEPESTPVDSDIGDGIIKVKLQLKQKKRGRKKKLSLKRDVIDIEDLPEINDENNGGACDQIVSLPESVPQNVEIPDVKATVERQKRKRTSKLDKLNTSDAEIVPSNNDSRPKRCVKRPVKYTEDAGLSSSDEDLHIFTPKKKKHIGNVNNDVVAKEKSKLVISAPEKPNIAKKVVKTTDTPKKPVKLAPIFASKQLDAAALEAKQKFLQSGVPDKLKKIIQQQKNNSQLSCDFPIVVHVQQRELVTENINHTFLGVSSSDDEQCPLTYEQDAFKKLINTVASSYTIDNREYLKKSTQTILQNIKQLHPRFPVYRTYRYLRGKGKGEFKDCSINVDNSIEIMSDVVDVNSDSPDKLNWTDKYKAMSTNQIIGNFESIKELRKWLVSWTENEMKSKSRANAGSDSSDYYQSDTDSRDSFKTMNNLLILTGPTGCGKTSSVYAVAADLAMKVIEVNASSKRTGKIMLQDLHEATQSHKVNRGTGTDCSQKSQEKGLTEALKISKKRGRPKKCLEKPKSLDKVELLSSTPSSQESTRTDMSLILIDDADIVFEQDDGFTSAIVQLVQCSKRPVILITTSLLCPHLQRFVQHGKILKLCPLLPRLLGTWLDIMCVADSGIGWPGAGAKFLNYFKGDIRKTINYLQFYISSYANSMNSEEETASQNVDNYKINIDDENSGMSWADNYDLEGRKLIPSNSNVDIPSHSMWTDFVDKHSNLTKFRYPTHLYDIWWSVPQLLNTSPINKMTRKCQSKQTVKELEAMADALDSISLSDSLTPVHPERNYDPTARPWYSAESDSVSELDNIDYYMNKYEVGDEICHTLVTGCISSAQEVLCCDRRTDISFPGMSLQRQRDKVIGRHKSLTTYLSPWSVLDRRSLALDYWSTCRTICRLEKCKNDANLNTKRNNRFCHYLKSLSVLCKSDTFDNLCDSLANEGTETNITNIYE